MILGIPSRKKVVTWSLWTPNISWSSILFHLWKLHICWDRSSTHSLFRNTLKNSRRPSQEKQATTVFQEEKSHESRPSGCSIEGGSSTVWTPLYHKAKPWWWLPELIQTWKSALATLPLTVWWAAFRHQVWLLQFLAELSTPPHESPMLMLLYLMGHL